MSHCMRALADERMPIKCISCIKYKNYSRAVKNLYMSQLLQSSISKSPKKCPYKIYLYIIWNVCPSRVVLGARNGVTHIFKNVDILMFPGLRKRVEWAVSKGDIDWHFISFSSVVYTVLCVHINKFKGIFRA